MKRQKPIVIVGAGPVGLCLAIGLAQANIEVILLEARNQQSIDGSRAIVIDHFALQYLDTIGCFQQILAAGLIPKRRRTFFQEQELDCTEFVQPDNGYPLFINIPQVITERILFQRLQELYYARIHMGYQVESIDQTPDGVIVQAYSDGHPMTINADYVVGCDGCRSMVRKSLDLEFPGETNPWQFNIIDVRANIAMEKEHCFYFSPPCNPGRTLLRVPQPDDVWRVDIQLPSGGIETFDTAACIAAALGTADYEIVWQSVYQFHQRLVKQMSVGRVFLAGDAAHLVNPFGARGMNSGIHDVACLVDLLCRVVGNGEDASVLEQYDILRLVKNQRHQKITRRTMEFVAPVCPDNLSWRDNILKTSVTCSTARLSVDSGKMCSIEDI